MQLEDLKNIVEQGEADKERVGPSLLAVITASDVHEGLFKLYARLASRVRERSSVAIVRDEAEALAWFGLSGISVDELRSPAKLVAEGN